MLLAQLLGGSTPLFAVHAIIIFISGLDAGLAHGYPINMMFPHIFHQVQVSDNIFAVFRKGLIDHSAAHAHQPAESKSS